MAFGAQFCNAGDLLDKDSFAANRPEAENGPVLRPHLFGEKKMKRFSVLPAWLVASFLAALGISSSTFAGTFVEQANHLTGYWSTATPRVGVPIVMLRISNVLSADKASARVVAYFGNTRSGTTEAKQSLATPAGDRLKLDLTLANDVKVELTANADMTAFEGTYTAPNQKPAELKLAKSSLAEIHGWLARNPDKESLKAKPNSVIEFVYISSLDCTWCRAWESEYLHGPAKLAKSDLWPSIKFTEQRRASLRTRENPENFPEHLKPVMRELAKSSRRLMSISPSYVVLVDGVPRTWASGTGDYATLIHATLEAAVHEKGTAATPPTKAL
jgi:hypothetical protein